MKMILRAKLLLILASCLALVACGGGGGGSSKPVKMVKVWKIAEEAKYSDQNMTDLKEKSKNYYDNNGLLYKKEFFDKATGLVKYYYKYTYKNGAVSKEEGFAIDDPNSPTNRSYAVMTMDEQGTVESYKHPGFTHDYDNTYDDDNPEQLKKREQDRSSIALPVDFTMEYIFNSNNTVEIIETFEKVDAKAWNNFTYSSKGNLESIETRRDNSAGALISKNTFEYFDENGDGRIDKHSRTVDTVGLMWVKTYKWEEYNVTEASTKQTIKGCRVRQGGCAVVGQSNDLYALPMMNYVQ